MDEDDFEECDDEPVASCCNCGCNIYAEEYDESGLCDQCQWAIREGTIYAWRTHDPEEKNDGN
jgi:hypothetical protein